MRKTTAAIITLSILSAVPSSASAAVEVISAENVVEHSAQFSIGLTTWLIFFGIAFLLFVLSLMNLPVNEAPEFCGLTAFMFFGLCGLSIPYVGYTQYVTEVVTNTTTGDIIQVVTPIIVSEGNWFMTAACIMMLFLSLVNAWRIVMLRVENAGPRDRRQRRRAELMERWR